MTSSWIYTIPTINGMVESLKSAVAFMSERMKKREMPVKQRRTTDFNVAHDKNNNNTDLHPEYAHLTYSYIWSWIH